MEVTDVMDYQLYPLGDQAIVIEVGNDINIETHRYIQFISNYLDESPPDWMIEYVPAYTTVTIFYNPLAIHQHTVFPYTYVCKELHHILSTLTIDSSPKHRIVEIPVCYGGEFGPDLAYVAEINGLTPEEVIDIHSSGDYLVYMIGFAPGFPYIGGMSEKIAAPRRKSPRLTIPERSVGIAGKQTGVYPIETPGGWQLIGRTPIKLFRPKGVSPSLLKAGDSIRFKPISHEEYLQLEKDES
ncbi:5-oxoprolinase subunit PxpB [Bacillus ginsengihumi]|uniref:5-oxoprolinase subunit PxpB n=2 Tax=Heyndrickxia ginsengihumi TaxID=363870 RepID=A0A6M0P3U4_9BACI|nr:5-oxoprolinase subunit PxpB [Bacillus sp. (in: firmicutes)]NEY19372.1 5-oxoprolinase subunit PxpB [Heyndrickxia ginsengihumi]